MGLGMSSLGAFGRERDLDWRIVRTPSHRLTLLHIKSRVIIKSYKTMYVYDHKFNNYKYGGRNFAGKINLVFRYSQDRI